MPQRNLSKGYFALRWSVLERDNFTCRYCGQHAPNVMLEVDHVVPVAEGGDDSLENLVTSCVSCNRGRNAALIMRAMTKRPSPHAIACRQGAEANDSRPSNYRQAQFVGLLGAHTEGMSTKEIADTTGMTTGAVRTTLCRLHRHGLAENSGGRWHLVDAKS
jgi:predicted Rossmann fold nucleotide-binding protein DprA/Smf involved in DNA uptake